MTFSEYVQIVATHGRRVANRVVLSATPFEQRTISDFYDCYSQESQDAAGGGVKIDMTDPRFRGVPENERATTKLIDTFDPTGWHDYYARSDEVPATGGKDSNGNDCFWPEPEAAPRVAAADTTLAPETSDPT